MLTSCRRCTQQRSLAGHAVTCTPSWYRACDADDTGSLRLGFSIGNKSVPILLTQCWFPGLAISNAKNINFSNKIYESNFIKQHSETVIVWNYQNADCSLKNNVIALSLAARLRQPCVTGDWLCQWEMPIFDPPTHTPLYRSPKFGTGDFVGGPYGCAKIWCKSVHRGFWANRLNKTIIFIFFYFSFSGIHLQVRPVDGLLRLMAQTTP